MVVYAIICADKNRRNTTVSGECYTKYDDAVKFIETRSGNPVKETEYIYNTDDILYLIKPLDVK